MKQRLLSLLAVCAMSVAAFAQWTAPVEPELTFAGEDYNADGTTAYYLYNVGCGQFVTGANSWATQISLTSDGMPYMELVVVPMSEADEEIYPGAVKLKLNGTFYFTGGNNRTNYAVSNTYLFRDSEASGYIDHNSQACWYWTFVKAENGNYYWHSAFNAEDGTVMGDFANAAEQYAQGNGAGSAVSFDADADAENIEWQFIPVATLSSAEVAAYSEAHKLYVARKALYDKLLEAQEYGVSTDDAGAVYNNADATVDELQEALDVLTPLVSRAAVLALIPQSSEDNPLDITKYTIENPDFENGQAPWTITEGMGVNLQVQATAYTNQDVDPVVTVRNWIESWLPQPGTLGNGVICQTVKGLPEGRYRIECDAIAVQQSGELDISEQEGIYLFYNNGSYVMHGEAISTGNGIPEHFTFDFDYSGAEEMTIGLMAENTNCNWMGMDNFRLYAIGECQDSPAYTALVVQYNTANTYNDDIKAQASLIDALVAALDEAQPLVDAASDKSQDAEYTAAFIAIKEAMEAVQESEKAYKTFEDFIARLDAESEEYVSKAGYEDFVSDIIEPLLNECNDAYDAGSWSAEQIQAAMDDYEPKFNAWTKQLFDAAVAAGETLEEPLDITCLFDDMSWAYTTSQVAFADGYPTDSTAVWMNETKTGNFKTNYSTAEVWNVRPFNIYREFTNLPKGRYTIATKAFFRVEDHEWNYENWTADGTYGQGFAYLYAGENKSNIINVAAIATDDPDRAEALGYSEIADDYGIYIPNSQLAGSKVFADAELAEKVYIAASGNVLNDGDVLRVGIAGTDDLLANQWTLWSGFTLLYNGAVSADDLNNDIQALIDQAQNILDGMEYGGVVETGTQLESAIEAGNAALESISDDDKIAAASDLSKAIAAASESYDLVQKLMSKAASYEANMSELPGTYTDNSYQEMLDEINECIGSETFSSNQQIKQWLDDLEAKWFDYILSDEGLATATVADPYDMTALLTNADFASQVSGWTVDCEKNGGTNADGVAEFWSSSVFDIYQELPKLTEGYWRLEANACFRGGNSGDILTALNTPDSVLVNYEYLYAKTANFNINKNVMLWSDITGGAIQYTEEEGEKVFSAEDQAIVDQITGQVDYSTDAYKFIAPNSRSSFSTFAAAGRYHNVINFHYTPADGAIRVGLKMTDVITVGYNWCPFDNFKLSYLGNTEAPDAVRDLNATEAAGLRGAQIFSIDGRQQQGLRRGINIVRGANGSVQKVLVK